VRCTRGTESLVIAVFPNKNRRDHHPEKEPERDEKEHNRQHNERQNNEEEETQRRECEHDFRGLDGMRWKILAKECVESIAIAILSTSTVLSATTDALRSSLFH
jgi:ABC-type Zn2+ transport system substrate-binding protein/surface adhesin